MGQIAQSPEVWVGLVVVAVVACVLTCMMFSHRPELRIEFLFGLIDRIPGGETGADVTKHRISEIPRQVT